ncbi:MAG: helix-turn-helix domain-containing protein [Pseudoramibacter sp.]
MKTIEDIDWTMGDEWPGLIEQISQEIINSRHALGMTQKELSNLTGISQSDISRIENGNANPSAKTLMRLAKALNRHIRLTFESNSEEV